MEKISLFLNITEPVKKTITNERAFIISQYEEEINKERLYNKIPKVNKKVLAIKLSVFKTNQELYEYLSICRDYKARNGSFSKRFYGGFKEQKFT